MISSIVFFVLGYGACWLITRRESDELDHIIANGPYNAGYDHGWDAGYNCCATTGELFSSEGQWFDIEVES